MGRSAGLQYVGAGVGISLVVPGNSVSSYRRLGFSGGTERGDRSPNSRSCPSITHRADGETISNHVDRILGQCGFGVSAPHGRCHNQDDQLGLLRKAGLHWNCGVDAIFDSTHSVWTIIRNESGKRSGKSSGADPVDVLGGGNHGGTFDGLFRASVWRALPEQQILTQTGRSFSMLYYLDMFSNWLKAIGLSAWIAHFEWLIPGSQTVHFFGNNIFDIPRQ